MPDRLPSDFQLTPPDEDLVRRALAEEDGAFERLVGRYKGLVTLVAFRQLGDAGEAEDIAQESFVRAFLSLSSLDEPARFRSWIARIATNIARDRLRRKKRHVMSIEDSRFDEKNVPGAVTGGGVSREMMAVESRHQLLESSQSSQYPER